MTDLDNVVSFIATAVPDKSRHFYESVLRFRCLADEPYALVFDLGGSTLRIQKVESLQAASHTVLGWEVDNIRQCVKRLASSGVRIESFPALPQDDLGIWCSPGGALVAWFKDPDGNTLSLTELPSS